MKNIAEKLVNRLKDHKKEAYFAGGYVRDTLLGKEAKDIDIATNATPEEVQNIFPNTEAIGAHFGVILVKEKGIAFEIATFRKDKEYKDSRRPEGVIFSSPEEDAKRRDFTINGLFLDPKENKIIDFVNGRNRAKGSVVNTCKYRIRSGVKSTFKYRHSSC